MNKTIKINRSISQPTEIIFEVDENIPLEKFKASGQMLVDSAQLSFVYLLEDEEAYTYIKIPETFWPDLKEGAACKAVVSMTNGKEKLLLENFFAELTYLIENIKGNSNYGDEMVQKVEASF